MLANGVYELVETHVIYHKVSCDQLVRAASDTGCPRSQRQTDNTEPNLATVASDVGHKMLCEWHADPDPRFKTSAEAAARCMRLRLSPRNSRA